MRKRKLPDKRGYINIWRKIWENPVSSRAKYFAVFIYILSHANYISKKTIIDGKTITIKRGQWLGSILQIAKHFKDISYTTVHRIVKWLKTDNIVDNKPTTKYTLFTVQNYDYYQSTDNKTDNKRITSGYQTDTTNKDNKDNKDNKGREITPTFLNKLGKDGKFSLLDITDELDRWEDWKASHGKRFKNNQAAFRNWLRKSLDFLKDKNPDLQIPKEPTKEELDADPLLKATIKAYEERRLM